MKKIRESTDLLAMLRDVKCRTSLLEAQLSRRVFWTRFVRFQKQNQGKLSNSLGSYFGGQGRRLVRKINENNLEKATDLLNWGNEGKALIALLRPTFTEAFIRGFRFADQQVAISVPKQESIGSAGKRLILGSPQLLLEQSTDADLIAIEGAKDAIDDALDKLTGQIEEATKDKIRQKLRVGIEKGLDIEAIKDSILSVFDVTETRARLIARTEMIRALNAGARKAYEDSGFLKDPDQVFTVRVDGTGEPRKGGAITVDGPPAHPNCRCAMALDVETGLLEWILSSDPCEICIAIFDENQADLKAAA